MSGAKTCAVRRAVLGGFAVLMVGASRVAAADPAPVRFAIPPQPLVGAMEAYARQTGVQVLYDAPPDRGLWSPGAEGAMSSTEALGRLLRGTPLVAQPAGAGAVILVRAAGPAPGAAGVDGADGAETRVDGDESPGVTLNLETVHVEAPPPRGPSTYAFYGLVVQSEIGAALRRDARSRRRKYAIRLRLWVAASGRIVRSRLVSSTGDRALDAALVQLIDGLPISRPPPSDMPQPLRVSVTVD